MIGILIKFNNQRQFEKEISIYSTVNELLAITEYKQSFFNETQKNVELTINFPLTNETLFKIFVAKIWDKEVSSKIFEKEVTNEKYNDSIASGNTGIVGNYDNCNNYSVTIGNLSPGERLELNSEFISLIGYNDKSYEFSLSVANYQKFQVNDKTQHKIFNIFKSNNKTVTSNFSLLLKTSSAITRLVITTHKLNSHFQLIIKQLKYYWKK